MISSPVSPRMTRSPNPSGMISTALRSSPRMRTRSSSSVPSVTSRASTPEKAPTISRLSSDPSLSTTPTASLMLPLEPKTKPRMSMSAMGNMNIQKMASRSRKVIFSS